MIKIHRVKENETLKNISLKYGVPAYVIAKENRIVEIKAGMRLIIPSPLGTKYVVKPYETIQSIALDNNIEINQLKSWNNGLDKVFLGQVIYLPYPEMD